MALAYLEIAELEYIDGNFENSINYLSNYRRLVRRPNARSLWLGVRVAYKRDNGDAMSSYGLALEKMFPESRENLAYQQWRKRL
ncbi:MAG: type IV pilus biogenesis/stability protein PilW, partial [Porticoccaceae bacterium]|nr:type IV pilus biogenesis/stability protein PilW [Porticoccaceae bacterium]